MRVKWRISQIELNLKKSRVAEMEAHAADPGAAPREDHDQRAAQELASMQVRVCVYSRRAGTVVPVATVRF